MTYRDRHRERQRAEQSRTQAGLERRDENVGTAPSSCSGLISGPSARHGIKQTGELWVRAGHRTPGRGEGRDGWISQWENIIITNPWGVIFYTSHLLRRVTAKDHGTLWSVCPGIMFNELTCSDLYIAQHTIILKCYPGNSC